LEVLRYCFYTAVISCVGYICGCWQKDEDEELIRRAQEGMNAEECQFSVEFPVKQEALIWSDKYRPRKPRFFNRVHTVYCATRHILFAADCMLIVTLLNVCILVSATGGPLLLLLMMKSGI